MNILFLSQRVPYPPNKGDKLRAFHEIRFLSQRHTISLVCLADDPNDLQHTSTLKEYCQSVDIVYHPESRAKIRSLFYLFSRVPLTLPYFYSKKLQTIVRQKLRESRYDLIFVYCSSMAQYVEQVHHIPRVIDFVDLDSEKWVQYASHTQFPYNYVYRSEGKRLRKYEERLAKTFQHCFFVSDKEVQDFQELVCSCPTVTPILVGVDSEVFHPSPEPYDPTSLVFTGTMDYFANVEAMLYFVREVLPHIQQSIPEVKLYIVGSRPSAEIQELGKEHAHIIVTGYVDQVQPYVLKSAVFVAPMRIARGVQNKILEAMAMGVPVVTTSLGFEGVTGVPGRDLFVEDHPERFAQQVVQLMTDPELRKHVSLNARQLVEEYYNWDKNFEQLERILLKARTHGAGEMS